MVDFDEDLDFEIEDSYAIQYNKDYDTYLQSLADDENRIPFQDGSANLILSEQEAEDYLNAWFNDNVLKYFYGSSTYHRSVESITSELNKKLQMYASKMSKAREKGERRRNMEFWVRRAAKELRAFIMDMNEKYLEVRPEPLNKARFKYSRGLYQQSSIMYFTTDLASRERAIKKAKSTKFNAQYPFFGQEFILDEIVPSRIFRKDGDYKARVDKIMGGITIENIAFNQNSDGGVVFYGWKNVEIEGWHNANGTLVRGPYRPFQAAIEWAKSQHPGLVTTTLIN